MTMTIERQINAGLTVFWEDHGRSPDEIAVNPADLVAMVESWFEEREQRNREIEAFFPESAAKDRWELEQFKASRPAGATVSHWVNPCDMTAVPVITDPELTPGMVRFDWST